MATIVNHLLLSERFILSTYSNYANNIFSRLRTLILSDYPNVTIVNERLFDPETDRVYTNHMARFKKGIGMWCTLEDFGEEGANANVRFYTFEVEVAVDDVQNDQEDITDLVERVKFTCEDNKYDSSGNWFRVEVSDIDYPDLNSEDPNIKKATMTMNFGVHYVIDSS